jgi:hypothetical protein
MGEVLPDEATDALARLRTDLDGELGERLQGHITRRELRALRARTDKLLRDPVYPQPNPDGRPIPWPAF